MRTLVLNYLVLAYDSLKDQALSIDYDASLAEKEVDGFSKFSSSGEKDKSPSIGKAYRFSGEKIDDDFLQVINGRVSVKAILAQAHEYQFNRRTYSGYW